MYSLCQVVTVNIRELPALFEVSCHKTESKCRADFFFFSPKLGSRLPLDCESKPSAVGVRRPAEQRVCRRWIGLAERFLLLCISGLSALPFSNL